jgi:hypothetical protein
MEAEGLVPGMLDMVNMDSIDEGTFIYSSHKAHTHLFSKAVVRKHTLLLTTAFPLTLPLSLGAALELEEKKNALEGLASALGVLNGPPKKVNGHAFSHQSIPSHPSHFTPLSPGARVEEVRFNAPDTVFDGQTHKLSRHVIVAICTD